MAGTSASIRIAAHRIGRQDPIKGLAGRPNLVVLHASGLLPGWTHWRSNPASEGRLQTRRLRLIRRVTTPFLISGILPQADARRSQTE